MGEIRFYSLEDIVGRADIHVVNPKYKSYIDERGIDLSSILHSSVPTGLHINTQVKLNPTVVREKPHIDEDIINFKEVYDQYVVVRVGVLFNE